MSDELAGRQDIDAYFAPRREEYQLIRFAVEQGIARLVLNRPPANVLSVEMMGEINTALESLEYRRDVKLLVVSATGKYFSAGFELNDHLGDRSYVMLEEFRRIVENLAKVDKPALAVVAGPALGAGCALVAACDMALAGASAKLGFPEIRGGVFNTVAAALLPRVVGRRRAYELLLGGQALSAAEAERIELVSRTVPDERLEAEAAALVQRFQEGSSVVLQYARRAMTGGLDLPLGDAVRHAEDVYLNQLMATEDAEEGLRAVMAKRKPAWKDR